MAGKMSVWSELKRRKVLRVAAAYAIGGWLLLQLTDVLRGLLELPNWIGRIVVLPHTLATERQRHFSEYRRPVHR